MSILVEIDNRKVVDDIKHKFSFFENFQLFKQPDKISVYRQHPTIPSLFYLPLYSGGKYIQGEYDDINTKSDSKSGSKSKKTLSTKIVDRHSGDSGDSDEDIHNKQLTETKSSKSTIHNKYTSLLSQTIQPPSLDNDIQETYTPKSTNAYTHKYQQSKSTTTKPSISKETIKSNTHSIPNTSTTKADFVFKGSLRPYQQNFYKELSDRKILTEENPTALVDVYPGFGKTIVGCKSSADLNLLTCVLTPLKFLETSWINVFKTFSDARLWIVGDKKSTKEYTELFDNIDNICISREEIKEYKTKHNNKTPKYWTHDGYSNIYVPDVIICMIDRVSHIPDEIIQRVGTLIIDEAHMFCTDNRISNILKFFPKYVMCLTATPIRSDGKNKMLSHLVGDNTQITRLPPKYKVIRCNTNIRYNINKKNIYSVRTSENMLVNDFNDYLSKLQKDTIRNDMIAKLCDVLIKADRKIIVMCRFKDHVLNIQQSLDKLSIKNDYVMGSKAKYKDSTVLMGTMSKMGTGFDEANVCEDFKGMKSDTLILTSSVKETSQLYQLMGRVFRSDNPLIIFLHDDYEVCDKHWKTNMKLLKQHDVEIEEVDLEELIG